MDIWGCGGGKRLNQYAKPKLQPENTPRLI